MVLAAGFGKRMQPITDTIPKPLVRIAGKTLLDWGLDRLATVGVEKAVVNVHYLPDQIVDHVISRKSPRIVISDERDGLLDSPAASSQHYLNWAPTRSSSSTPILSGSTLAHPTSPVPFLPGTMRAWIFSSCSLTATKRQAISGSTDFLMAPDGQLSRADGALEGLIYVGARIVHPPAFLQVLRPRLNCSTAILIKRFQPDVFTACICMVSESPSVRQTP